MQNGNLEHAKLVVVISDYYPGRFTGRGVVEFTIKKGGGSTFFPVSGGEAKNVAKLKVNRTANKL